jgi:hypothetical protein
LKLLVNLVAGFFLIIFTEISFASCYVTGLTKIQNQIDLAFEERLADDLEFKKLRKEILMFAKKKHGNQLYGGYPYVIHLGSVEKILRDFGFTPDKGIDARRLLLAAWLHDSIEDTSATFAQIQLKYGTDMAKLVDAVSKITKQQGLSEEASNLGTLNKIVREHPLAHVLKLADRIANMQFGKTYEGRILPKYYNEWPLFRNILYPSSQQQGDQRVEKMWQFADKLLGF